MLNFRLHLPLVLCPLYILFPQVQAQSPPGCATQCSSSAASQAGCGPYAPDSILTMPYTRFNRRRLIDCSADTACVCNSVTFQQAATSCVMQACGTSDTEAAVAYFNSLCPSAAPLAPGNFKLYASKMTHRACGLTKPSPAASSSTSPVTSPSQSVPGSPLSTATEVFSNPTTSASSPRIESTVEGPQKTIIITSQPISNPPTPAPSSSLSGSASASPPARTSPSSPSSRPSSSNAAATPVRAATLVAGGIGALFAVVV